MNRRKFFTHSIGGLMGGLVGSKLGMAMCTPTDPSGSGPSMYETYINAKQKMEEAVNYDLTQGYGYFSFHHDWFSLQPVDLPMPDRARNELNERHERNMDVLAELKERLLLNAG